MSAAWNMEKAQWEHRSMGIRKEEHVCAVPHRRNRTVTNYEQGTRRKDTATLKVRVSTAVQG